MEVFFLWIILSFIIGSIGSYRKIGFGGAFFISLIFSPLIGLIFVLISKTKEEEKYKQKILHTQKSQEESLKILSKSKIIQKISIADEIEKLQSLKNNNSITEEEFVRLKNKIIYSDIDNEEPNINILENKETITTINENTKKPPLYLNPNTKQEKPNLFIGVLISLGIIFIIVLVKNCNNNSGNTKSYFNNTISELAVDTSVNLSDVPKEIIESDKTILKNFTYEDVARYAMATSMQEPIEIVKSKKRVNYYYVTYVRPSDSQKFEYKVKFEGNRIIWGDLNGRWQDTEYDEKISFEEIDNKINIIGVGDTAEFKKGD